MELLLQPIKRDASALNVQPKQRKQRVPRLRARAPRAREKEDAQKPKRPRPKPRRQQRARHKEEREERVVYQLQRQFLDCSLD
jgi:hypothetical protein